VGQYIAIGLLQAEHRLNPFGIDVVEIRSEGVVIVMQGQTAQLISASSRQAAF